MLGISKEQVNAMPHVTFPGRMIVIETAADANAAVRFLMKQTHLGFDTETRPSYHKGRTYKVALIQISTDTECFLFRINKTGLCDSIRQLLENENIIKIGLSLKDDFNGLAKYGEFNPAGFVELQSYVKDFSIADNSLQKIYAIVFGECITKGQRLTNWEADQLTEHQQQYASIDAWSCLRLYRYLESGAFDPEKSPYHIIEQQESEEQIKQHD